MTNLKELRIPHMGSVENARLVTWHIEQGAAYAAGQVLYEVETDKTLTEVAADEDGVLAHRVADEGDEMKVGDLVGWWAAAGTSAEALAAAVLAMKSGRVAETGSSAAQVGVRVSPVAVIPDRQEAGAAEDTRISPRVRQLAREHGIDLATVVGTGPGGRISGDDVLRVAAGTRSSSAPAASSEGVELPAGYTGIPCEVRANSTRRRTIARRLAESARSAPHLTADMQIDLGALLEIRSQLNTRRKADGLATVSVLSFIAAAVCRLLPQHPDLNATFTDAHTLHWRIVNLGIAVDTPDGLVVPVIRDAARLELAELNDAIATIATRAREGTLRADELEGGTFTISNPGSMGPVLRAEAILNPPQVALLGLPGMLHAPVAIEDGHGGHRVEVRPLLRPALTFDHRALDGGQVIRFLNALKRELETDPR